MKIEKLIERVKAGDADALRTVYETYSQRMRNVCIRITQEDEDTVSDLVQESFIRAYYSLEKLKDASKFGEWIVAITKNVSLRYLERMHKIQMVPFSAIKDGFDVESSFASDSKLEEKELFELIDKLPSGYRKVFRMAVIEGFSHKEIAEKVNSIGEGLEAALAKSMKSERLKTDLITNVSHDIKTPLTSIINYVELLKQEDLKDPKIQRYIEVLEQKSQRLKTLTEDVVEASKVSSGNITLEFMNLNLVEMIQQTSGEFEEKFKARDLEEVMNLPNEEVVIRADGRRLWRVLSNIYNNAAKYAMQGTRVYADLEKKDGMAYFSLKNVSEQPLNISADELTERFIRGDVSRSTEGSGLGLSIAQSLTEMQGGTFELYLDGDLFKVTIKFPIS